MSNNQKMAAGSIVIFVALGLLYILVFRGYGEVSPKAYEFASAIYGACLTKNQTRLQKAAELIAADEELPDNERRILNSMIQTAQNGSWESAAANAKRLLKAQAKKVSP